MMGKHDPFLDESRQGKAMKKFGGLASRGKKVVLLEIASHIDSVELSSGNLT